MSKTLLVTGDTHGTIRKLSALVEELLSGQGLDRVIHLGDFVEDAEGLARLFPALPIIMVAGNNDFLRRDIPRERVLRLEGHGLFLIHGHTYPGEAGAKKMRKNAQKKNCDIVLFGHTHRFFMEEKEGILRINPGSPTRPRGDHIPSALLLTLEKGAPPKAERLALDDPGSSY